MTDIANAFVPHSPVPLKGAADGPLSGLTFAVKDLYDTQGDVSGGGSPDWFASHEPAVGTSPLVTRLLAAGADMVGKTICDELFYSFIGNNAHYGTPLNSKAPDRMPGGSSSGSAAAVAASSCDFSIGSDTGGSVRVPAAFCGLFGIRPTHGRVDLSNAIPMAQSFDTGGWFTRDAELFARLGKYFLSPPSNAMPIEKIVIVDWAFDHADEEVSGPLFSFLSRAADHLPAIEHQEELIEGLDLAVALDTFRIIQASEVWENFGPWVEARHPKFGPGIKERMEMASSLSSEEKARAQADRPKIKSLLQSLVKPGTVLCLPTTASLPPLLTMPDEAMFEYRVKNMSIICLSPLASLPQISIPAANQNGVPVGLSFMGWSGSDEVLLDLAAKLGPYCEP